MAEANWDKPAVVIDNGTGYTKMGYAGNCEPNFIIPTLIATKPGGAGSGVSGRGAKEGIGDLGRDAPQDGLPANPGGVKVLIPKWAVPELAQSEPLLVGASLPPPKLDPQGLADDPAGDDETPGMANDRMGRSPHGRGGPPSGVNGDLCVRSVVPIAAIPDWFERAVPADQEA